MKSDEIIKVTNADAIGQTNTNPVMNISTDTRTIKKGDFYLPLKGASFDGEKFIRESLQKGALGAFFTDEKNIQSIKDEFKDKIFLRVNDTLTAYLQLANYRRNKINPKVVAVTGSSGKTTTKELVYAVLNEKYKTFKTPLNHNNEIGFCQTIFEMPKDTEVLVLEAGMRGLGEIELISKYAEPDITIISNVGTAHIGRLGSREKIAKAKCEIVKYQRGNTFIGHDDAIIKKILEFEGEKIYYSLKDVKIIEKTSSYSKFEYARNIYELNVGGDYNIENALAAINCGIKSGLEVKEICEGLKKYHPIEKRWEAINSGGYEIINDSYNANPESMKVFVDTISELYKDYIPILGDMGELGTGEINYHKKLGEYINGKTMPQDTVIMTIGTLSKYISDEISNYRTKHFQNTEDAVRFIKENIPKNKKLFLKASRSMKFERIVDLLNEA